MHAKINNPKHMQINGELFICFLEDTLLRKEVNKKLTVNKVQDVGKAHAYT